MAETNDANTKGLRGVETALSVVLKVKKGDQVVVITDSQKSDIGDFFVEGAKRLGAEASTYRLPDNMRPIGDIPTDMANSFKKTDVFINAFEGYAEETPFRIKLTDMEMALGARVGHAPGITMDMLLNGPMQADYVLMAERAYRLKDRFEGVTEVHVTAPSGTDFVVSLKNRAFQTDVEIPRGAIGNLPAGEIWCAPVEDSMNGVIVVDGSIGDLRKLKDPLYMFVENGKLVAMECQEPGILARLEKLLSVDDMARIVGEFGIGLNNNARLTGNLLEEEKAGRTAHIAFGRNIDMPGGQNISQTHRDFLFYYPTITVTYEDGSTSIVMKDGEVDWN